MPLAMTRISLKCSIDSPASLRWDRKVCSCEDKKAENIGSKQNYLAQNVLRYFTRRISHCVVRLIVLEGYGLNWPPRHVYHVLKSRHTAFRFSHISLGRGTTAMMEPRPLWSRVTMPYPLSHREKLLHCTYYCVKTVLCRALSR